MLLLKLTHRRNVLLIRLLVIGFLCSWGGTSFASPVPVNQSEKPSGTQGTGSRGYLTTPQELREIKGKAKKGVEPYASAVGNVLEYARRPWPWPELSGKVNCPEAGDPPYLAEGNVLIYAKALAYWLRGDEQYAREVKSEIEGLLAIQEFEDRQCRLNVSWAIPGFIRAADLIEDNAAWRQSGLKRKFQEWLARVVYPTISLSAEVSVSNWGAAATNACTYIADFLWDRPDLKLVSRNRPGSPEAETVHTPAEAYEHAIQLSLGRMNGERTEGKGGSHDACDLSPSTKSMIRPDGAIPDELRRGSTGCDGRRILQNDKSNMYSQTHLQNVIAQAELLWRRGDRRIYDNIEESSSSFSYTDSRGVARTVTLPAGRGSLKQAILFVLNNPSDQTPRGLKSACEVAYRYYRDPIMLKAVVRSRPNIGDRAMSFTTLTHGFASTENPGPPITTPPAK